MTRLGKRALLPLVPAVLLLLLWELGTLSSPERAFFVGSPSGVWREFRNLLWSQNLVTHVVITASEALIGFLIGSIMGTTCGLALWLSRSVADISRPYILALGSVPVFALGPVLIFWFGTGFVSKVVLAAFSTFVIALSHARTGTQEADINLLRVVRAFGASKVAMFRTVIVPSATIWVLSGARLGIGMALLGAFVGEFLSSRAGLGHLIVVAEGLYNVNQIWVGSLCLVGIAALFQGATIPVERWAKRWRPIA